MSPTKSKTTNSSLKDLVNTQNQTAIAKVEYKPLFGYTSTNYSETALLISGNPNSVRIILEQIQLLVKLFNEPDKPSPKKTNPNPPACQLFN